MTDERQEPVPRDPDPADLFSVVVSTYASNVLRAMDARIAHQTIVAVVPMLNATWKSAQTDLVKGMPSGVQEGLDLLSKMSAAEYDAFVYIGRLSMLVYFTTLFDTFLQDTIEFLLCLHPSSIGESAVSFERVLKAGSREEILNAAVKAKVREVGFDSFSARLRWLREHFGLDCKVTAEDAAEIGHFSGIRNVIVHDQGFFDFYIDTRGSVALEHRACPRHPTLVTERDLAKAKLAFSQVVASISDAVFSQVLKQAPQKSIADLIQMLRTLSA
jgi:hypothetical protein